MKFSSVIYILVLFGLTRSIPLPKSNNAKGMGHEKFSESQTQVLLYRLDHAAGDEHQLGFFKMLLLSQNSVGSCKEQGNCIEDIVNTIEQVALWYTINLEARNLTALQQAKYYTEQLKDVERDYQTRLNSLPEPFKYWYALSMNESISSFLGYELKKLQRLQLELLVAGEFNSAWIKIGEISAHCFAAVQSGVKTFQIMGFNFDANQKATNKLASWFHFQYDSQVVKRLFRDNFNVGKRDESPPRDIAADMNYLREGLSITIKAGMFLLLCMQYQVYLCSVAFGFMISMSCFIWISVYLEMLSTTV